MAENENVEEGTVVGYYYALVSEDGTRELIPYDEEKSPVPDALYGTVVGYYLAVVSEDGTSRLVNVNPEDF